MNTALTTDATWNGQHPMTQLCDAKAIKTCDVMERPGTIIKHPHRERMGSPLLKKAISADSNDTSDTSMAEISNDYDDVSDDASAEWEGVPTFELSRRQQCDDVNPTFYSHHSKCDIVDCIASVAHKLGYECKKHPNKVLVTGLLCAEEVSFVVSLQVSSTKKDQTRIDFNRIEGDELNFVRMCDIFESLVTVFDADPSVPNHPESWLDVDGPQLCPCPPFYPEQFVSLCNEYLDESGWSDSIYVAASIKSLCLPKSHRAKIVKMPSLHTVLDNTVSKMILSPSYEVSRYGVFVLSLFKDCDARVFKYEASVDDTIQDMQATDAIPRMRDIARMAGNVLHSLYAPCASQ